jgi:hypothetical protein
VSWPAPQPGLVVRYSYLWEREAQLGREEGVKDRPCAILLVVQRDDDAAPLVRVLPITHTPPDKETVAVEIPTTTKRRLGLDAERSWIVVSEGNEFRWPGPDLRPAVNGDPASVVFGMLPPSLFAKVREAFLATYRARGARVVPRTE